ncbi:MAG: YaiI/YqxD family protein [Alphaproteobacteria bacterium]
MMSAFHIFIDADACPVREETYKVALRHAVPVTVVANAFIRIPPHDLIKRIIVSDSFDAADDYIAERAKAGVVVITADILLADRCLKAGAKAIGSNGKEFTENSIGAAIATRTIMADLRAGATSENIGGPPPFTARDRSQFLQTLHETLVKLKVT